MAASVQTRYYHGASPGVASGDVTGTTVRYKLADNDVQDSNNPIQLPNAGLNLSWRKSSKVNFTTSPAGSITNLRWFLATVMLTGIRLFARVQIANQYIVASAADVAGIAGFTDTVPNQNTNDAVNYTSSTPLTVVAGTVLSNPNTGEGSPQVFVETQASVGSTYNGGPGPIAPFTLTYRYNET
jgi:hypothetical protein